MTSRNKQKFTGLYQKLTGFYQKLLMNPAEMCHVAAGAETEASRDLAAGGFVSG